MHPVAFAEPFGLLRRRIRLLPDTVVAFPEGVRAGTGAVAVNGSLADGAHDVAVAPGKVAAINRVSGRAGAEARLSSTQMAADYVAVYERILEANG